MIQSNQTITVESRTAFTNPFRFHLQSKNTTKNLLANLNVVGGVVLKKKLAFDKSTDISSPSLNMSLQRASVDEVGGRVSTGAGQFNLPGGKDLFGNKDNKLDGVSQQVRKRVKYSSMT